MPVDPVSRRRWIIGSLAFVVIYSGVLLAFALDNVRGDVAVRGTDDPPSGGVFVDATPRSIDASAQTMVVAVRVNLDAALTNEDSSPKDPITLQVGPTIDDAVLTYPPGNRTQVKQVQLLISGDIQDWPFDDYQTRLVIQASVRQGAKENDLPTTVAFDGAVQGWHLRPSGTPISLPGYAETGLSVRRSLGTIIVGLSLIVVLIALPLLGLFVAINVYRGRRKLESAFASWIAAMLFATIPIRNFLPGAPPPGSWIDITVVLWVIIALIAALVFWAAAWWQAHPPDSGSPPDPDGSIDAPVATDTAATANAS